MLTKRVQVLVLIASLAASLVAYYAMHDWLASFAYRAPIQISIFVIATVLISALAFASVAVQAGRTALRNPVDALRYE
jgi:putative ABC transport system permease protein